MRVDIKSIPPERIARYCTDDRDLPVNEQRELVILPNGENGWMIDVVHVNEIPQDPVLVLMHGEKAKNRLLSILVGCAYHNIMHKQNPANFVYRASYQELLEELSAWQYTLNKTTDNQHSINMQDDGGDFAVFVSDDDSLPENKRRVLQLLSGGNGDWYVQGFNKNQYDFRGVRLATSGGASRNVPLLCVHVACSYYAISNYEQADTLQYPSYDEAIAQAEQYRDQNPELHYDGLHIRNKLKSVYDELD